MTWPPRIERAAAAMWSGGARVRRSHMQQESSSQNILSVNGLQTPRPSQRIGEVVARVVPRLAVDVDDAGGEG